MSLETHRYEIELTFLYKILNVPGKTLRHRLNNIFYTCNYHNNYARNDTSYRKCSEGNQISDKLNFFQESIVKFQTNLRSLLYYRLT